MSTQGELSIIEAFAARHSVRVYKETSGAEKERYIQTAQRIVAEVNSIPTPFGTNPTIGIHPEGLATMGTVSGEAGWLMLQIPKNKENTPEYAQFCMDAAFRAHIAVLKLTQNRVGTGWVGGSFNQSKT